MRISPLLLIDFYKATHAEQYPLKCEKIVSYLTPRMTRVPGIDYVISAGAQGYAIEYLRDMFQEEFFSKPISEIIAEYRLVMDNCLAPNVVNYKKIRDLHALGYLPIRLRTIPEGTKVPIHVPMIEITNTDPQFAWLVNTLETALSNYIWHMQISANVGYQFRQIVDEFYEKSVDDDIPRSRAVSDFSMRGQESVESAIKSSAAFCFSFSTTATAPAVLYLEHCYDADCEREPVVLGAISTEHSVMNSNYAIDGDEETMVRRLLNDIYPNNGFSMVSDSYDYWNMLDVIVPACKEDILKHNGYFSIRGDSGDPVEVLTKTVFKLWDIFGGHINSKGFKVLNAKVKANYGDSITFSRLRQIYQILIDNGFAANNVGVGSGSFSMQCLEIDFPKPTEAIAALRESLEAENNLEALTLLQQIEDKFPEKSYNPYTRDTFGVAVKATYCEVDGVPTPIFKDPKTDTGNFKKSQKGCCIVYRDESGIIKYSDGHDYTKVLYTPENMFVTVFENGAVFKDSLSEIRNRLHNEKF